MLESTWHVKGRCIHCPNGYYRDLKTISRQNSGHLAWVPEKHGLFTIQSRYGLAMDDSWRSPTTTTTPFLATKTLWRFGRIRSTISANSIRDGHITKVARGASGDFINLKIYRLSPSDVLIGVRYACVHRGDCTCVFVSVCVILCLKKEICLFVVLI
jgi:hypothetical protein